VEDATEAVSSAYIQVGDSLWIRYRIGDGAQRGGLVQGLVGSVLVVEVFVLVQYVPKMAFVPDQAAVEKLVTARLHPPLRDRVHPRHLDTGEHRLDAALGEELVHEGRELPIPVSEQKARLAARIVQIACCRCG
jgi:hypothetical protein